ncbi:AglZ/HisF2 family acetamidino modification protein [Microscilla marina]|uniref:imidazole glycerol-phosphate synthase n=1 Tax=Microscilla marina ATCC 23134 TaxID=313606 RepID=A1ZI94_MICM2|nr:AglZ/HisF2 family acetamidino modification protein [Microscilla marina]EAY29762.1 imidazole glycerol phosphate synthase subunit HisF [Microscilla marina ATCC 23134]
MLKTRVIPCLLLRGESLIKTIKFDKYGYIGDPINTVRIFNELEVDELVFLDITATRENRPPNLDILREIADECFMPLAYGGGVKSVEDVRNILSIGLEKVVINSHAITNPNFITEIADTFGSQSIIASIDIKKNFWGKYEVLGVSGTKKTKLNYVEWAQELERLGAGELLITSMDREGTWKGYDVDLVRKITDSVSLPVIANGGAGNLQHIEEVVKQGNASAVALGSMVVYQGQDLGVLVNFPDRQKLSNIFG